MPEISLVDLVLLGGRDNEKSQFNRQYKYFLTIGESDILERVFEAIDESERIERVFFVGPTELIAERAQGREKEYILVEEVGTLMDNLRAGLERQQQLSGKSTAMIACSDLPFITGKTLDWIAENSYVEAGIGIPIVTQETLGQLSSTYESYYWPMAEGGFKWADNVVVLDVNILSNERLARLADEYRATGPYTFLNPIRRAGMIMRLMGAEGLCTILLNYISKCAQMRLDDLDYVPFSSLRKKRDYEGLLSRMLGFPVRMIELPYVDTCLDVDNARRLEIFRRGYQRIDRIISR